MGAVFGLLVMLGVLTLPALAGAWVFYLSLVTVGQDFLSFQWDALLLEAGFLAIFFGRRAWPKLRGGAVPRLCRPLSCGWSAGCCSA